MELSKIDPNFSIPTEISRPNLIWLDAADSPFVLFGATSAKPYCRMPPEVAKTVSEGVLDLCSNTAGIRLRFVTDSPYLAIHAEWAASGCTSRMTLLARFGFDLYEVDEHRYQHFVTPAFVPPVDAPHGYESVVDLGEGGMREYILNFPLYNAVSALFIGVKEGCRFEKPRSYRNEKPVVFYGSSITQGGCASRPGNCYQNFLSRMLDMDYVNLGFSGSGRAEDNMIEYLRGLDMSVFVSDYDHNAPTAAYLRDTHHKLYRAIREAHPHIPYIMISKPDFKGDRAGSEDAARRAVIMESYLRARESGDNNVYFIDGASFFADDERDACTVDGCHPNDLGFYRMAKRMLPVLQTALDGRFH